MIDPLEFDIVEGVLVYTRQTRQVVRFPVERLIIQCPMPACEWFGTSPTSDAGAALAVYARRHHAASCHPEALEAGALVLTGDAPYDHEGVRLLRGGVEVDLPASPGPQGTPEEWAAWDLAHGRRSVVES